VHDDHRLHPRLRQKRLDRSISRPFLPRASRSLRFDQTETNSCDHGKRGSNIRDRGQIHLQFLLAKDRLSSRRNAIEVDDRPLRGRFHLASSTGLLDPPYAAAKKKPQDSHGTLRL
jgi:hypothetical protein